MAEMTRAEMRQRLWEIEAMGSTSLALAVSTKAVIGKGAIRVVDEEALQRQLDVIQTAINEQRVAIADLAKLVREGA